MHLFSKTREKKNGDNKTNPNRYLGYPRMHSYMVLASALFNVLSGNQSISVEMIVFNHLKFWYDRYTSIQKLTEFIVFFILNIQIIKVIYALLVKSNKNINILRSTNVRFFDSWRSLLKLNFRLCVGPLGNHSVKINIFT